MVTPLQSKINSKNKPSIEYRNQYQNVTIPSDNSEDTASQTKDTSKEECYWNGETITFRSSLYKSTWKKDEKDVYRKSEEEIKHSIQLNDHVSQNRETTQYRDRSREGKQRFYVDKDEPNREKRQICRWHKRGLCKFGNRCWHHHPNTQQRNEYTSKANYIVTNKQICREPFQFEAQRDWANTY
jgi:hypothetical protein